MTASLGAKRLPQAPTAATVALNSWSMMMGGLRWPCLADKAMNVGTADAHTFDRNE
jgi:hypothetical protein